MVFLESERQTMTNASQKHELVENINTSIQKKNIPHSIYYFFLSSNNNKHVSLCFLFCDSQSNNLWAPNSLPCDLNQLIHRVFLPNRFRKPTLLHDTLITSELTREYSLNTAVLSERDSNKNERRLCCVLW